MTLYICIILAVCITAIVYFMIPDVVQEFKKVFCKKPDNKSKLLRIDGMMIYNKKGQRVA